MMKQLQKLAEFIMREVPGEPSQSEGAGDCAIRIIKERDAVIKRLRALVAAVASAPFPIHDHVTKEQWEEACNIYAAIKGGE